MNWRKEVALTMTEEKKQTAPQEMSAEEVMKKYDKESDKRNPVGAWHYIISGICILFACFQLYTAIFGVLDAHLQRTIHLMFGLTLIFLLYPGRKSWSRSSMNPIDVICALLGIGTTGYLLLNYQELVLRAGLNTQTAPQEMSAEEVMKKYDKESDKRNPVGAWHYIISGICILFACFQLYTAIFGVLDAHLQRTIHLMFGLTLIFLLYPGRKSWSRSSMNPIDVICALLGIGTTGYLLLNYQELVLRAGLNTQTDIIVGIIGVLMVFEATRRTVGWPMLTVALIFVAYAFLGPYMPGILAHRGVGFDELVSHLFFTTEGIFGVPMGVSSTFIYLFILFGAYLDATGLGKFFIDMANALAGWAIGGPAKVAVLSSGLMGTVSGSSVANLSLIHI